jgi:hypothetical protein
MLEIGVDALPMVALMAMCSGFILAMQGASELRRFGALHYVIDLVAVGFTRELGPLLTAIAVSGRSGSAFAAEIGTMTVTEEIAALKGHGVRTGGVRVSAKVSGGTGGRSGGQFSMVSMYDGRPNNDYVFSGKLEKLEEVDYESGVKVEVAMSAQITKVATGATVWSNAVSETGTVSQRNVRGVVSEMNRTVDLAINKLLSTVPAPLASER